MKSPATNPVLPNRGFLLHISHYDPDWCKVKDQEVPFDLEVGLEIVDCMASVGLNLLVVDCADGLRYASHPELTRHYSHPLEILVSLALAARQQSIEIVPLLNFAQSDSFQNNHWLRPHHLLFDSDDYWRYAFEIIDELIEAARPPRFFHIGMDEDHWRSHRQYVEAIKTLQAGLAERRLRTIIWNASALSKPEFEVFKEKSHLAETAVPKEIVQILFDYVDVQPEIFQRIKEAGFEIWGAPGPNPTQVEAMRQTLLEQAGQGILLTRWLPCIPANRAKLLDHLHTLGPLCSSVVSS